MKSTEANVQDHSLGVSGQAFPTSDAQHPVQRIHGSLVRQRRQCSTLLLLLPAAKGSLSSASFTSTFGNPYRRWSRPDGLILEFNHLLLDLLVRVLHSLSGQKTPIREIRPAPA